MSERPDDSVSSVDTSAGAGADEIVSGVVAAAAPESGESPTQTAVRRQHLYEVDILRILTFVCVIAVHVVSHVASATDVGQNGFLILVHFTREVFFALTAFVLVYSFLGRPRPLREFWPKRFLLVALPYVTWSAVYVLSAWIQNPSGTLLGLLPTFWKDLYTGSAWYHLYFLLVTMQVYLLLPVLVWLVRKTRGHHWLVLAAALAVELAIVGSYQYFPALTASFNRYSRIEFWSYEFLIVAGAIAADHVEGFLGWVRSHRPLIAWITVAGAAASIVVYAVNLGLGQSPVKASTALQPIVIVWSIPVALAFLAVGTAWADRRRAGSRFARLVDTASDRSFGIFLAHPYLIWVILLAWGGWLRAVFPGPVTSVVVYVLVVVGTVALVEILRRTPLSLPLTGRPYRSRRRAAVRR